MVENSIINPILRGFHPDPCICAADGVYYIAVSSFEWLPGVRIYASRDLVRWEHETDALTDQVDLRGNPRGGSIWAPMLSYSGGLFYLLYTDVKSTKRPFKDTHNYLITAPDIHGPWSTPVYLHSSGFDPSLFHDADGRKWLLSELWDHRMPTPNKSCGIVMQQYDAARQMLTGEIYKIFDGTPLAKTEAPHLYRKGDYYYLITAEGGTGSGHSVTVCRARQITGPYELDPHYPMLTAADKPDSPLQCSGHMSLVQSSDGRWYGAYLCTRPLAGEHAILGRETAIQEVIWSEDGWLRLRDGGNAPAKQTTIGSTTAVKQSFFTDFIDNFEGSALKKEWNTLRIPLSQDWASLQARPGYLRVVSGESPQSLFDHHILAVRQKDFRFTAETALDFAPDSFLQMAGLLLYLNDASYLYACVTHEETSGRCLRLIRCENDEPIVSPVVLPLEEGEVTLRIVVQGLQGQFFYRQGADWQTIGERIHLGFLSGGFTGNFVGIAVHDMGKKQGCYADFSHFSYHGQDEEETM